MKMSKSESKRMKLACKEMAQDVVEEYRPIKIAPKDIKEVRVTINVNEWGKLKSTLYITLLGGTNRAYSHPNYIPKCQVDKDYPDMIFSHSLSELALVLNTFLIRKFDGK